MIDETEKHAADAFAYALRTMLQEAIKPDKILMHLGCDVYCSVPVLKTEIEQDKLTTTITMDWSMELPATIISEYGGIIRYESEKYLQSKKMINRLKSL